MERLTRNIGDFTRFLETMSFLHSSVLNISYVARECQIERKVVESHTTMLEDLLLALPILPQAKVAFQRDNGEARETKSAGARAPLQVTPPASQSSMEKRQPKAVQENALPAPKTTGGHNPMNRTFLLCLNTGISIFCRGAGLLRPPLRFLEFRHHSREGGKLFCERKNRTVAFSFKQKFVSAPRACNHFPFSFSLEALNFSALWTLVVMNGKGGHP